MDGFSSVSAILFTLAVLHTFVANRFHRAASRCRGGTISRWILSLLGEVELTFLLWAVVLYLALSAQIGLRAAAKTFQALHFEEALFVFVVMVVAATRPILLSAERVMNRVSQSLFLDPRLSLPFVALVVGPLSGSFITEPAAMTVTALALKDRYFAPSTSLRLRYALLAVLLVNVSIGGVLTPYAAPPVLMVAGRWGWDFSWMMRYFGWKAILAVIVNASLVVTAFRRDLLQLEPVFSPPSSAPVPRWIVVLHVLALIGVVSFANSPIRLLGMFTLFVAVTRFTQKHQSPLRIREALLVACFLAGLVTLGHFQAGWVAAVLSQLHDRSLFLGATVLTSVVDNAALTYLGAQVELSEAMKLALVQGAVTGGGLTVIANAPNPIAFAAVRKSFEPDGIRPALLVKWALLPTAVAALCFRLL